MLRVMNTKHDYSPTCFTPLYFLVPGPPKTRFGYEGPTLLLDRTLYQDKNTKEIYHSAKKPRF